jgi:hypothetical protein
MKPICLLLVLVAPAAARADVVLDWNQAALETIRRTSTPPPAAARALAMVHVAMYDAVNSIEHTHRPFRAYTPESFSTSREAAAAQAAFRVLSSLYPSERDVLERTLAESLAPVPQSSGKTAGVFLGNAVAERIIAWRSADGSQRTVAHAARYEPGQWRPTPPGYKAALLPQWASVAPFGVATASHFRPAFPPDLTSAEYARHFQEVKDLGRADSTVRTPEQTEIAHYWADGAGTVTPPGHWNRIAQSVARSSGLTLHENARLFTLLNVALADAAIVCWDMKYACNLWRPVTAIHEAHRDGNELTQPDRSWRPLLETPPFPSCTSGHSTFSGAAAELLTLYFGRGDVQFTDVSENGRSRTFAGFSQAANEAGRSRIYGGIHYDFDNSTGLASGRAVARYVFANHLQPLGLSTGELASRQTYRPAITAKPAQTTALDDSGWRPASNNIAASPAIVNSPILSYNAVTSYSPVISYPAIAAPTITSWCATPIQVLSPVMQLPQPAAAYSILLSQ